MEMSEIKRGDVLWDSSKKIRQVKVTETSIAGCPGSVKVQPLQPKDEHDYSFRIHFELHRTELDALKAQEVVLNERVARAKKTLTKAEKDLRSIRGQIKAKSGDVGTYEG